MLNYDMPIIVKILKSFASSLSGFFFYIYIYKCFFPIESSLQLHYNALLGRVFVVIDSPHFLQIPLSYSTIEELFSVLHQTRVSHL